MHEARGVQNSIFGKNILTIKSLCYNEDFVNYCQKEELIFVAESQTGWMDVREKKKNPSN